MEQLLVMDLDQHRMRNDFKERADVTPAKKIRLGETDTQPPMMTFKAFLQSQDDNISDEEATAKYAQYKLEFRRQQLNDFFNAHKEEEWFKLKYHPKESLRRKQGLKAAIQKRAEIFKNILESRMVEDIVLDADHSFSVERFLDIFVIKLEGGSDVDLINLDIPELKTDERGVKKTDLIVKDDNSANNNNPIEKNNYEWIIIDDVGGDDEDANAKLDQMNDVLQFSDEKKIKEDILSKKQKEMYTFMKHKDQDMNQNEVIPLTPCPIHKTRSLFLRNVSPRVTKAEIEQVCQSYPGFLRVWLSESQQDQHWARRGFITFRRNVNIKQICWKLNNIKIKDCEWQVGVNHDLSKRCRIVKGYLHHKKVVHSDLKMAVKVIQHLDSEAELWKHEQMDMSGLEEGNPILKSVTDFIAEVRPSESNELLSGNSVPDEEYHCNADTIKALDKLLLYLRIVHSVDYYNASHYMCEDEMPNRCGIIHLRESPSLKQTLEKNVDEYIEGHMKKLELIITPKPLLSEPEMIPLGMKVKESEIEKFILANTQELGKDKWLCPLSGKKFKAPEFIRKHVLNKYVKQLEDIKEEVDYFNNYLMDPKRPELPEHPGFLVGKKEPELTYHFPFGGGFRRGFGFAHFGGHGFFRGRGMMGRGRGMDFRPVVTYRDLDSPCEPEDAA